jgi:hypothetical protein
VFASDEYYLLADRPFPAPEAYEAFAMHEDGIGMARTFELEFAGHAADATGVREGFFAWADGSPAGGRYEAAGDYDAPADGYRAARTAAVGCGDGGNGGGAVAVAIRPPKDAPIGILTGAYGARVLAPLVDGLGRHDVRIIPVDNQFFGGTTAVTGLLVGEDLSRTLAGEPAGHRYLLPDVCLSGGRFLDGTTPDDLPRPVEVVPTDGIALRRALGDGEPRS